jgi:hypothetical protein
MRKPRARSKRASRALAWSVLWFVAAQFAVRTAIHLRPELADREFGRKVAELRRMRAAAPDRPLVLMLGSSRVATGFRPGCLPRIGAEPKQEPLLYNFAQVGSGPEMALLSLHRLVALKVRPDWVLVEFWPPTWTTQRSLKEFSEQINIAALDRESVRLLARYVARPRRLRRDWLAAQWVPLYFNRDVLLHRLAPALTLKQGEDDRRCRDLDRFGWWSPTRAVDRTEHQRLVERYRRFYTPRLQSFHIEPTPDRALRALLELCRREGIRASLVVLPEGSEFRTLYPPEALQDVTAYLARVERECGVSVIDARRWVGDDGFIDGHHLLPSGATVFTRRLAGEVLQPLLAAARPTQRR